MDKAEYVSHKVIKAPLLPLECDFPQQEAMLRRSTELHEAKVTSNDASPTYDCSNRMPDQSETTGGMFFPVLAADISESNPTATY